MESLNDENDLILTLRESRKTSLLLNVENATWLVETKLDDFVKNKQSDDDYQMQLTTEEKESWSDVVEKIKGEIAGLIEIEKKLNASKSDGNELEKYLEQLRAKFLSEQNVSSPTFVILCGINCRLIVIHLRSHFPF